MSRERANKVMIRYIEVETHIHATEDVDKVITILRTLLDQWPILVEVAWGHHGNPLLRVQGRASNTKLINGFLAKLCRGLDGPEQLANHLVTRFSEPGNSYLRLNKGALAQGKFVIEDLGDYVVRIKAKFEGPVSKEALREFLEEICGGE